MTPAAAVVRRRVRVEGIVQGVGYRPFVHGLASRLRLGGFVGNDARGVFAEVEGAEGAVAEFLRCLVAEAPPLAVVESVTAEEADPAGTSSFEIVASARGGEAATLISADTAPCAECVLEIFDPAQRRYRYPFTNCTNCGPRFTIVRGVPYDRPFTTMASFPLCPACASEYHDPADRRFHAQPVCCPACGPRLRLVSRDGTALTSADPLRATAALLMEGNVLAIKGLGGYHLATLAAHDEAVATLRSRKHREDKPFAVMCANLEVAGRLVRVTPAGAALLAGPRRPIVLLDRRSGAPVAAAVAPGNRSLGVMLPYTPLHHLLAAEVGLPFVLTSGNRSDEPIAFRDEDALERLGEIADAFLIHDRPIHTRTDDSVARAFRGGAVPLRRSRGYAPEPLRWAAGRWRRPVLATGAELKSTFCLAKGQHAFVSHHIGDLENYETYASFTEGIDHFERLFDIRPEVVAHDHHPEYLSTKYALERDGVDLVAVQHHHAHIASCLADNGEAGPVIGLACDGLGYGLDGTIWGGEILLADLAGFTRAGHFTPVPMPGGTKAIREPWRMAAAYLDAAYEGAIPAGISLARDHEERWGTVLQMARAGLSSPLTSSAGRLFDAVAALVGLRGTVNYEGQAAIELEQSADPAERGAYALEVEEDDGVLQLSGPSLVRAVVDDLVAGAPPGAVAARFHNGVADGLVACCARLRAATGLGTVALSGGVFQNMWLLGRTIDGLESHGFKVLTHSRVPPNDGGISLGQAAVAGARDG